jgi:hypothetical protein
MIAYKYISKLDPKYGIQGNLAADLLRIFKQSHTLTNEDLIYFVTHVLNQTLKNEDPGIYKNTTYHFKMQLGSLCRVIM